MQENSAKYFNNKSCRYYPCHRVEDSENFNCLFCYCPLYTLGDGCGGDFRYTEKGIKDCMNCTIPHCVGGYEYVMEHIHGVTEMVRKIGVDDIV